MTKRTCRRRTFAQIRSEQDRAIAKWIDHHAEKLDASEQSDTATAVRALAGMIRAGFVETSNPIAPASQAGSSADSGIMPSPAVGAAVQEFSL